MVRDGPGVLDLARLREAATAPAAILYGMRSVGGCDVLVQRQKTNVRVHFSSPTQQSTFLPLVWTT